MSSNGPIRKPPPTRTMRSIWSCEEIRWPSSRRASSMNGRAARLATKPIPSAARIGSRPIARATSVGGGQRLLGCLVAGDDFDQAHPRRRVEEVHAADPVGLFDSGGDRGHGQGGGVGGEDRVRAANLLQPREQAPLELEVLRRSFDHELAVRDVLQAWRLAKPRGRRLGGARAPAPALGPSGERLAQLRGTRLERGRDRVVEVGVKPPEAGELGDAGAPSVPAPRTATRSITGRSYYRQCVGCFSQG